MDTEQELRPLDAEALAKADLAACDRYADLTGDVMPHSMGQAVRTAIRTYLAARRSSDEQAEVVESRDVLFFASYCGGDSPACTPARPCADCIAMGNVYSIPANTPVLFQREFGASPPAVAAGGVTEEMLKSALAASASQYEVARNLQGSSPKSYLECFGEATPPELAMRAALTAALAVRDEGIREGWQPIETAPKDGTHFIAWDGFHVFECMWNGQWAQAQTLSGRPWTKLWQPLPTPPSRGEGV